VVSDVPNSDKDGSAPCGRLLPTDEPRLICNMCASNLCLRRCKCPSNTAMPFCKRDRAGSTPRRRRRPASASQTALPFARRCSAAIRRPNRQQMPHQHRTWPNFPVRGWQTLQMPQPRQIASVVTCRFLLPIQESREEPSLCTQPQLDQSSAVGPGTICRGNFVPTRSQDTQKLVNFFHFRYGPFASF
jgi:hypothetical protein